MHRVKVYGYYEFLTEEDLRSEFGEVPTGRVMELLERRENQPLDFVVQAVAYEEES